MSKLDEVVKGFVIYKCSKLKKSSGHESRGWEKKTSKLRSRIYLQKTTVLNRSSQT